MNRNDLVGKAEATSNASFSWMDFASKHGIDPNNYEIIGIEFVWINRSFTPKMLIVEKGISKGETKVIGKSLEGNVSFADCLGLLQNFNIQLRFQASEYLDYEIHEEPE